MRLIVGSALFVNKIRILFRKKKTINLKPNSLRTHIDLEDWFPYQTGQTFCRTDQWYFPVHRRRTRSQIWNLEPSSMPTLSACNIIRIYSKLKGRRLRNRKPSTRQHRIWMRENGGSLDFNFISLLNAMVDENWVCWHHLLQFIL